MPKSQEPRKEALKGLSDYQAQLATALFNQETERDRTIVLITAGALTVSFAFITSFVEHHGLSRLNWLIAAWASWVAALILAIIAYSLSISGYKSRIAALSEGRWDDVRKLPRASKLAEPANYLVTIAMILGFVCFGFFSIGNLQVLQHDKEKFAAPTSSPAAAVPAAGPTTPSAAPAKAGDSSVQEGKLNASGAARSAEDPKPEGSK
jgi:hypothetical protein